MSLCLLKNRHILMRKRPLFRFNFGISSMIPFILYEAETLKSDNANYFVIDLILVVHHTKSKEVFKHGADFKPF